MERNTLYPIFVKTEQIKILIVGGGYVAAEKLGFLTKSSPNAQIDMVAPFFREGTLSLVDTFGVHSIRRPFLPIDLDGKQMVIVATDNPELNERIYSLCRAKGILVNVADNPPLCDFYMGGIVTKGNLKVAISTNGKSPTVAKRLRQLFEEILPEELDELLDNLNAYRATLKGDFEDKVNELNRVTRGLVTEK
jgi:precorrin-2 dehydrogenase/sirohydrochlorin ferrochelatase